MHFVPAALVCLALGGLIGAAQGFWIAYFKIPSFIVTLAGMLVFKGLMIAVLGGRSLGPFDETFQKLSSGYIPEFITSASGLYMTSLLLGLALAVLLVWQSFRSRPRRISHDVETEPFGFFVGKIGR